MENLVYALVQLVHNFGAVAVTAAPFAAFSPARLAPESRRGLARLVAAAWLVQIASGIAFGATSLHYYGVLPDLSRVARAALIVKVSCALAGTALVTLLFARGARWTEAAHGRAWRALAALGATALAGAAVLRWFS